MKQPLLIGVIAAIAIVMNASAFVVTEVEQAIIRSLVSPLGTRSLSQAFTGKFHSFKRFFALISVGWSGMVKLQNADQRKDVYLCRYLCSMENRGPSEVLSECS